MLLATISLPCPQPENSKLSPRTSSSIRPSVRRNMHPLFREQLVPESRPEETEHERRFDSEQAASSTSSAPSPSSTSTNDATRPLMRYCMPPARSCCPRRNMIVQLSAWAGLGGELPKRTPNERQGSSSGVKVRLLRLIYSFCISSICSTDTGTRRNN